MTIVLAASDEKGNIVMASDRMVRWSGTVIKPTEKSKMFSCGDILIGVSGGYACSQWVANYFRPVPVREGVEISNHEYITRFARSMREELLENAILTNGELDGDFLVAYKGSIYVIYSDFSLLSDSRGYMAIGAGSPYALPSYSLAKLNPNYRTTEERIRATMNAVSEFCSSVSAEYDLEILPLSGGGQNV